MVDVACFPSALKDVAGNCFCMLASMGRAAGGVAATTRMECASSRRIILSIVENSGSADGLLGSIYVFEKDAV